MKLAMSNIAWARHDDPLVLDKLKEFFIDGIEIAPTKIWPSWEGANYSSAKKYSIFMKQCGFEVPALQAILFGRPDLQVFDLESHENFYKHIRLVAELASGLGAKVLVFGAPKNRKRGQLLYSDAQNISLEFFFKAAAICNEYGCCLGLEANPVEYGCDFVTNTADAKQLVDLVNHSSFKLHLDSAAIYMCGGNLGEVVHEAGEFVHFHISEPMLAPVYEGQVDHYEIKRALKKCNYNGWVSVEMAQVESVDILEESIKHVANLFHDG